MALLFSALLIMSVSPLLLPAPSQSLSLSSSSSLSLSSSSPATTTNTKIEVRIADVASDLSAIRDCRRSAYGGKPANLLSAAKSFCDADQITRDGYVCVIATAAAEGGGGGGRAAAVVVGGPADFNTWTGVVNNVYVREEARKRGIARSMMVAVEDYYHAWWTTGGGGDDIGGKEKGRRRKLSLTVMSKNLPAVGLYRGMGYAAPGVYGGLDALSAMSPLNFLIEMEKEIIA